MLATLERRPDVSAFIGYEDSRQMPAAKRALQFSAAAWFVVAALGQLIFALSGAAYYGVTALRGEFVHWNKIFPHAYVAGDVFGNLIVGFHLVFAVVIMCAGVLQLWPSLRQWAPRWHRWNGRLYLSAAIATSVVGLLMMWWRGTVGDLSQHIGTSLNALIIIVCAVIAWRYARAKRFDLHRRWALRVFLAASGVWFFRIMLFLWLVLNQGPVGFDGKTFTGPALTLIAFAQYLLPLSVLQLYFWAQDHGRTAGRVSTSILLGVLTMLTAAGVVAASMIIWLPRLHIL
jgi:Predicted membrane protein (DUF2306)